MKPRLDDALNTVTVLLLFVVAFSWYAIGPNSPLISLVNTIKLAFAELTNPAPAGGTASTSVLATPQVFTIATWINLLLSVIAYLFLIIGFLAMALRPKKTGISSSIS